MQLLEWREFKRNTLLGFATAEFGNGLVIADVSVHERGGRRWASMPGKPQLDRDGNVIRGEDGRPKYVPILSFSSKDRREAFSSALIVELVEAGHLPAEVA